MNTLSMRDAMTKTLRSKTARKARAHLLDSICPISNKTREYSKSAKIGRAIRDLEALPGPLDETYWHLMGSQAWKDARAVLETMASLSEKENGAIFGCRSPSVLVETETRNGIRYFPIATHRFGKNIRDHWTVDRCGECEDCIARQTYQWAQRAHAESLLSADNYLITRTFAEPEPALGNALEANAKFRNKAKVVFDRLGVRWRATTALEYGKLRQRKHFHDNLFGVPMQALREFLGGHWFVDPKNPGGFVVWSERWPFGHINVRPIEDPKAAAYAVKYSHKAKALSRVPSMAMERDLIAKLGDPILNSYVSHVRNPGLGDEGVRSLAQEQAERILDMRLREPHERLFNKDPSGLLLDGKPMLLTPRHKHIVADEMTRISGDLITVDNLFAVDLKVSRSAYLDVIRGPVQHDSVSGEIFDLGDPSGLFKFLEREMPHEAVHDVQ